MKREDFLLQVESILSLMEEGLTQKEIAERIEITYGQLQYQLKKYREQLKNEPHNVNDIQSGSEFTEVSDVEFETIGEDDENDILTALPVDASTLYVYWNISNRRKRIMEHHLGRSWHDVEKKLRIYDVTFISFNGDNAHRYWDIPINALANNWFVRDAGPGCAFIVDYGVSSSNGNFLTVLRSNAIESPPDQPRSLREKRMSKIEFPQSVKSAEHPEWYNAFTGYSLAK
jgi:hypothetical protein